MKSEKRYLCMYFPQWSIEVTTRNLRLKGSEHEPPSILLTNSAANQLLISRYCINAMHAGVRAQMPLPLARALCPDAYVESFDPIRDFEALSTLARWCLRFSPIVGLDYELVAARNSNTLYYVDKHHYGITIDLTGTERLHGDLAQLSRAICSIFQGRAQVALTPTIGASWALSRYAKQHTAPSIVLSQHTLLESLEPLPLQALRIDPACIKLLKEVGVACIGELLRIPRHSLTQRFGKKLLYRLEQALGQIEERITTVHTPRDYTQSRSFEPPLTNRKAISIAIQHLLQALITDLKSDKKVAKYFHLTLCDTENYRITKELSLATASSNALHLSSIIESIIDTLNFFGEARELQITAKQIEGVTTKQHTFSRSHQRNPIERETQELINNFCVRIGKDRVTRAKLCQSYIPERSFSYESVLNSHDDVRVAEQITPHSLEERPSIILSSPEPISTIAMLPDKPPSFITWRGRKLSIITGIGPERIAPEWWGTNTSLECFAERDYFKIQDESGYWLWVYRDRASLNWFLHGMWV